MKIRTTIHGLFFMAGLLVSVAPEMMAQEAQASTERCELVLNGDFEKGIDSWYGQKSDSKGFVPAPEMISLEKQDTPDKSAGALHLTIKKDANFTYPSHVAGAICPLKEHIPANRDATISFWAKSLSGANVLSIGRVCGGGFTTVVIDNTWKKYDLVFRSTFSTPSLIFSLVPQNVPNLQILADGECLIGKISVQAELPKITVADFKYGPHERQTFDFWRSPNTKSAPVFVFIHGGGWLGGDKSGYPGFRATVDGFHQKGISVANVNYRFSSDAILPAPVHDAARAIQVLRSKADEWGIDKTRIAATGDSAGGCTVLWLATHDDLADPKSEDPVARESTRLCGVVADGAQSTIDPVVIRKDVYDTALAHQMICRGAGFSDNKAMDAGYEKAAALYHEFSPINHLSADDPPIWLNYQGPVTDPAEGIHSSRFGVIFKKKADEVGSTCYLTIYRNPEMYPKVPDRQEFIYQILKVDPSKK